MTDASSHPSTTEPMNVTEPIRCGLARAAEGYESGIELEDIAALLDAYDRLTGAAQARMLPCPVCGGEAIHAIDVLKRTTIASAHPTQGGDRGEAVAEMRETAAELRANSNGDCNAIMQAVMWEKKAAAIAAPQPTTAAYSVPGCGEDIQWRRVNDEPYEYAVQQGPHGVEFVKLLNGACLCRTLLIPSTGRSPVLSEIQAALNSTSEF